MKKDDLTKMQEKAARKTYEAAFMSELKSILTRQAKKNAEEWAKTVAPDFQDQLIERLSNEFSERLPAMIEKEVKAIVRELRICAW